MILEARKVNEREVSITSRFSRYLIEFTEDEIYLSAPGLDETFQATDFPREAENIAIAVYLVAQLESRLIGD